MRAPKLRAKLYHKKTGCHSILNDSPFKFKRGRVFLKRIKGHFLRMKTSPETSFPLSPQAFKSI